MSRRELFHLLGAAAVSACAPARSERAVRAPAAPSPSPSSPSGRTAAVAFDLFTLFDPRGVDRAAVELGLSPALVAAFKTRLFEYSWLRAASGQYRDFEALSGDALRYAARVQGVVLDERAERGLGGALGELEPWPDSRAVLEQLRGRGLKLATLANFTPGMIRRLLGRAGLLAHFDALISTDQARTFKPDPRAYALAESVLRLPRAQVAFSAFGGWDAAGGHWFGFPTFWVNRLAQPVEELASGYASGPDLSALVRWLESRA